MSYYDRIGKNERLAEDLPDVKELAPSNPFWSAIPPGMQLTYDGNNFPNGLEAVASPTAEQQASIDLQAAGVNFGSLLIARYMNDRGDPAPLATIDASIDAVVISSGLTLAQVAALV